MALHLTPEQHDANPPSTWRVVRVAPHCWHLKQADATLGVIDTFTTKKAAEQARSTGLAASLYEKEGRWFAGLPVSGWKPYVPPDSAG